MKSWMVLFCSVMVSHGIWAEATIPPGNSLKEATYISLESRGAQEKNLTLLLKAGAQRVKSTEPNTEIWFALTREGNQFALFNAFTDATGRAAHLNGQVITALKQNSERLIEGGWENGVIKNIQNSTILVSNNDQRDRLDQAQLASYLTFKPIPGKEKELDTLLQKVVALINRVEPNTLFWVALKNEDDSYALFAVFSDMDALNAHFSGVAATTIQQNSAQLIQDGWTHGVMKNIKNYDVIASR
ncbi:putative quinol monooxygenase [Legionella taurinensis]|nr:hypothetical protein [Legionella taurinensis]MDX1836826.1 hypothetical protein [Legionella taurinensis]